MRTIKRRIDHLEAQHHIGDDTVEVVTVLQRPDGTRYETHRGRATQAELDDAAATMQTEVDALRVHYAAAPPLTLVDIEKMSIMQLICAGYANAAIARLEAYRQDRDVDVQDIELEQQLRAIVASVDEGNLPH